MHQLPILRFSLAVYCALFILFLYAPFIVMGILSYQAGPEGGPQFPIIEWSTYWYQHVLGFAPPSRVAPLPIGEALVRSLTLAFATMVVSTVLGTLTDKGVPPHHLKLKIGAVAIIMRNLNFSSGLCNGTKVIIRDILPSRRLMMVEVPKDGQQGEIVPIPRVSFRFQPAGKGIDVTRKQFPLRPAYALTHNKSQVEQFFILQNERTN